MRDDEFIAQLLSNLHGKIDDSSDTSSFDNTIIQYFTAPRDRCVISTTLYASVQGPATTIPLSENLTTTTQMSTFYSDRTKLTWNGASAGWYWGYGGVWS